MRAGNPDYPNPGHEGAGCHQVTELHQGGHGLKAVWSASGQPGTDCHRQQATTGPSSERGRSGKTGINCERLVWHNNAGKNGSTPTEPHNPEL
jgi:hypothetical protein